MTDLETAALIVTIYMIGLIVAYIIVYRRDDDNR
jgi:hypothetical protein